MTDIAIAHKDYDVRGGGEVFCRRLAEAIDAPLYVGRRNHRNEPDDAHLDIREIPLSRLDKWMIDRYGLTRTVAYMLRWQAAGKELSDYETVITSGNEPLWYVPPDRQTLIAYTHSTPRFMYDLYTETMDFSGLGGRLGALFHTAMRTVYQANVPRPDLWVANSDIVARRIRRYWNIAREQIRVVYPPVNVRDYSPDTAPTGDFYLHLGRLAGHKRVDTVLDAWQAIDAPLKVAGRGPERKRLERQAPDNVEFLGFVSEECKAELMSAARAHVYPAQNEDFGMVPIESLAAGTPVLAVDEGFQREQIRNGVNGYRYKRGELRAALRRFEREGVTMTPDDMAAWAEQFNVERFERQMREAIADARDRTRVGTNIRWPDADAGRVRTPAEAD